MQKFGMRVLRAVLASLVVMIASSPRSSARVEGAPVIVLAAGDIAQCEGVGLVERLGSLIKRTGVFGVKEPSALLDRLPVTVLALGDLVSGQGTTGEFANCYDPNWGRYKSRTLPAPGNHEYQTRGAIPYFAYFGSRAGHNGTGYYSVDLGSWHVVSLNSSIAAGPGSRQDLWLRADLEAARNRCVLAFWHNPPFHPGPFRRNADQLFRTVHEFGATIVLTGHAHYFQRFTPQDAEGNPQPNRGTRVFIVGTRGAKLHIRSRPHRTANSERFQAGTWGLLRLSLEDDGYAWQFVWAKGKSFSDTGRGRCVDRTSVPVSKAGVQLYRPDAID